jgi:hypothetical protein
VVWQIRPGQLLQPSHLIAVHEELFGQVWIPIKGSACSLTNKNEREDRSGSVGYESNSLSTPHRDKIALATVFAKSRTRLFKVENVEGQPNDNTSVIKAVCSLAYAR